MKLKLNNKLFGLYFLILLLPIFFLLNGEIYFEPSIHISSQKNIYTVPIPISYIFSIILIFYLFYKKGFEILKNKIFKILFFSSIVILIILTLSKNLNTDRVLELIQFLIPWMGLFIAINLENNKNIFKIIFYFLFCILSLQLFFTFFLDKTIIVSDLLFFSVYQNIQYVGVIFTLLTILVSINLFNNKKFAVIFLIILSLIYSTLTYSFSSLFIWIFFFSGYLIKLIFREKKHIIYILKYLLIFIIFLLISFSFFNYSIKNIDQDKFRTKLSGGGKNYYENMMKFNDLINLKIPKNITLRLTIWEKYYQKIIDDKKILILGDKDREMDTIYQSAHNLFLDIIYKFGLILISPYLFLFFLVLFKLYALKSNEKDFMSLLLVFLVVLTENIFKVSLKQPYPGIISFYLIGYYLKK